MRSFAKQFAMGMLVCLEFACCNKSESLPADQQPELSGDWSLSDLMIVNASDKPGRKFSDFPKTNDLRIIMEAGGRLSGGNTARGSWTRSKDRLQLQFEGEEVLDLRICELTAKMLVLEHEYGTSGKSDAGTLYYAFVR